MAEIRFPNESDAYREARQELLKSEIKLREMIETVAEQRRELPVGGSLEKDYIFDEIVSGEVVQTRFSQLLVQIF